jgi:acyl dehydratase
MSVIRRKAIEGIRPGDRFVVQRTFGLQELRQFAALSRDYNPVHFDQRFAAAKGFSSTICHGLLVAALLTEIGGQIGWLASGMNFRYRKPVYVGDTIQCELIVEAVDEEGRAGAKALFRNQDGEIVIESTLQGIVPGPREQAVMRQMVDEGDPTNPLHNQ